MALEAGWLSRLRARLAGPASMPRGTAGEEEDAIAPLSPIPVVMVTVLGVEDHLLEEIVAVTGRKFSPRHRLVFVTESPEFGVFRRAGVVFEYMPSLLQQSLHADVMNWPAYLAERWSMLLVKWRPVHVIAYGQNMPAFLEAGSAAVASRAQAERP